MLYVMLVIYPGNIIEHSTISPSPHAPESKCIKACSSAHLCVPIRRHGSPLLPLPNKSTLERTRNVLTNISPHHTHTHDNTGVQQLLHTANATLYRRTTSRNPTTSHVPRHHLDIPEFLRLCSKAPHKCREFRQLRSMTVNGDPARFLDRERSFSPEGRSDFRCEVLGDVGDGVQSLLERSALKRVSVPEVWRLDACNKDWDTGG